MMSFLFQSCRRASCLRIKAAMVLNLVGPKINCVAKVGKVFLVGRMFTAVSVQEARDTIHFRPKTDQAKTEDSYAFALCTLIADAVNLFRTLFRALQLSIIFTPLLLISPLAAWSEKHRAWWFRVLVRTLEISGPVCVKLGQWASTRRDLFPLRLCQELSKLQRQTCVHSWKDTEAVLIENYGEDYSNLLQFDSKEPVGSGCCAQVYRARLRLANGVGDVAVKVLHPGTEALFNRDLRLMSSFVGALTWLFPSLEYLSLCESLSEFSSLMKGQINLSEETKNLQTFHKFFENSENVIFPWPVVKLCSKNIIVETFEKGTHINDFIESSTFGEELQLRKEIAEIGIQMLLKMVFVDNFVHGDLHPGNILVRPDARGEGKHKLVILDPAIVSSLGAKDLQNFRSVFTAVVRGKGAAVGRLFLEHSSHQCPTPEAFVKEMEGIVLEARSQQLSLSRLNVSELLTKVFNTLLRHRVKLEANYASVILAILVLEGLGRTLDPNIDILLKAIPYLLKS